MRIKKESIILFQGDSVTDCGRNKEDINSLGNGYPMMAAAFFGATYPELKVKFVNKGISGNRVKDLDARWKKDCIDIKPDVVSILIGINDCWRKFDDNDPTTAIEFKATYHKILTEIKEKLHAKIIICEPFLLPVKEEQKVLWREDLDPKIHVARELAREFEALYIPFDGVFAEASTKQTLGFWAADGVHPTLAGHALIAKTWLETVKQLTMDN